MYHFRAIETKRNRGHESDTRPRILKGQRMMQSTDITSAGMHDLRPVRPVTAVQIRYPLG